MTWPDLGDDHFAIKVADAPLVVDRRNGTVVALDDVAGFVVEHRALFADIDDAAIVLADVFARDRAELKDELADLGRWGGEAPPPLDSTGTAEGRTRLDPPSDRPRQTWILDIVGTSVEVSCYDAVVQTIIAPYLSAYPIGRRDAVRHRFAIWRDVDSFSVGDDGYCIHGCVSLGQAIDGLIAGITSVVFLPAQSEPVMHAAAVVHHGSATVLAGRSGNGKSTTTVELLGRGFDYLTDEVVQLDPVTGRVRGLPRAIGLDGDYRLLHPELQPAWSHESNPDRWVVEPSTLANVVGGGDLGLMVFLEYAPGETPRTVALDPVGFFVRLVASFFNPGALTPATLEHLALLVVQKPAVIVRHAGAAAAANVVDRLTGCGAGGRVRRSR